MSLLATGGVNDPTIVIMKEEIEIYINDTPYISVGSYLDNNDGIIAYWPEAKEGWIKFFSEENPLIIL